MRGSPSPGTRFAPWFRPAPDSLREAEWPRPCDVRWGWPRLGAALPWLPKELLSSLTIPGGSVDGRSRSRPLESAAAQVIVCMATGVPEFPGEENNSYNIDL